MDLYAPVANEAPEGIVDPGDRHGLAFGAALGGDESALVSISLLTVAVLCVLALLAAFQAWAYVDQHWASSKIAGLRLPILTGLILVAFVTLPTLGISIVLGAGTANRCLDLVEPNLFLCRWRPSSWRSTSCSRRPATS
ncbi:hypothetical protein [Micromonospora marina]|uniref:hypothetical protein n=1 Tax=Micromonospora marina TaxID=307120 RepID=UPI003D7078B0